MNSSGRTAGGWHLEEIARDEFSPFPGQVIFVLSRQPLRAEEVKAMVNGVAYSKGKDYDVFDVVVAWDPAVFVLAPTDSVVVEYPVSRQREPLLVPP